MPFGPEQFGKPTPQKMSILFDGLSAILSILAGFFTAAAFINHSFSDIAVSIINLLLIPLCPVFKRMFGVDLPPGPVAKEDIKVVEEHKD